MNRNCTQEFLDLKNPTIIKTILENLNKSALVLFLQQRGFSINDLKKAPKSRLIDEVIKTFNLPAEGCNSAKKEFYYNVLTQKPSCLSNTERSRIQALVDTSDMQKRRDILNTLDANTIYMLSSHFDVPNAKNMNIEELRQILIRMSSNGRTPLTTMNAASSQAYSYMETPQPVPPVLAGFLNARTIADRRDILRKLNKQQLFVLATYFKIPDYKTQTRENIIKKLLYNIPPPNETSIKTDRVSLTQKIISGFRNAQTISTRKDYLNTLDKQSLLILAEHYDVPNKNREEIVNYLVYKIPPTPVVAPISSTCNIPKNVQFFSEREKRIVKSFINATNTESKKKLLNSLSKEDLLILAQKFNIYGYSSLNSAQLREQIFKNGNTGVSLIDNFEFAQTPAQRKEILNFLDKRGLMMIAKKYNIANINKMPAESIRNALFRLPYLNYKPSSYNNACEIPSYAGGASKTASRATAGNLIITPNPTTPSSPSIAVSKALPPPMDLGDKIITPFRTRQPDDRVSSVSYTTSGCQTSPLPSCSSFPSTNSHEVAGPCGATTSGCQTSPLPKTVPNVLNQSRARSAALAQIIKTTPIAKRSPPSVYASPQVSIRSPPINLTSRQVADLAGPLEMTRNKPLDLLSFQNLMDNLYYGFVQTQQIIETVPTSFTRTPLKIKSIASASPPMSTRSTSSVYTSPQVSNRSTSSVYTSPQEFADPLEVGRNKSCLYETPSPSVEISNVSQSLKSDLSSLQNLLDLLYDKFQTSKKVIANRDLIKLKIDKYLKENPLYGDDGTRITVENHSFYSNGLLLLGDENEQKAQVEELKRRMPYINWTAVSGIVGVGLVHLYSWWLYNMAGNLFGPSTATGFNVTDAYFPQGGTNPGLFAPAPAPVLLTNNFEPNSAVGFPTNTAVGYSCLPEPAREGYPTDVGFPTNTALGYSCLAGPAFDKAVGFLKNTAVGFSKV